MEDIVCVQLRDLMTVVTAKTWAAFARAHLHQSSIASEVFFRMDSIVFSPAVYALDLQPRHDLILNSQSLRKQELFSTYTEKRTGLGITKNSPRAHFVTAQD
jgi:hypothetical protein